MTVLIDQKVKKVRDPIFAGESRDLTIVWYDNVNALVTVDSKSPKVYFHAADESLIGSIAADASSSGATTVFKLTSSVIPTTAFQHNALMTVVDGSIDSTFTVMLVMKIDILKISLAT